MRIGIDVRLWHETGVGRYIRNLVKHLSFQDDTNDYIFFAKPADISQIKEAITKRNKWKVVAADIHWHSFREQLQFPRILHNEHLDLMHFPYFSLPVFYQKPFVITVHDLIIHHFSTGRASTLPLPLYAFKRTAYKMVLQQAVNRSQKIIAPLESTKKDLVKTLGVPESKVAVTYEGVDEGLANGEWRMDSFDIQEKYFLYVGNAYPHKNLERLLKAFSAFDYHDVKLVLVGKEDYFYKKINEQLKRKNNDAIIILHNVTDVQLSALYKHALAVVAPSVMEGFGLVPLEALSKGTLVVASDIPAHAEVCKDAALYFNPENADSLLDRLREAYNLSDEKRKEFAALGFLQVERFSWEKMAKETIAIYESSVRIRQS